MTTEETRERAAGFIRALEEHVETAQILSRAWESLTFAQATKWAPQGYPADLPDFDEHTEALAQWLRTLKGAK